MSKHTPGPWRIDNRRDEFEIVGRPTWPAKRFGVKGEWSVATIEDLERDGDNSEGEANARLIAAAPDMLEALRAWISWMDSDGSLDGFDGDHEDKMLADMRKAIAAATGEV